MFVRTWGETNTAHERKVMMGLILRTAAVCLLLAGNAQAADLVSIDADAMSGDPKRILKSIHAYESLDSDGADVLWRLIRA